MKFLSLVIALSIGISCSLEAATFTVNVTTDGLAAHDANPGDGVCLTAGGDCTMRAAIEEANANSGPDVILFDANFVLTGVSLSPAVGALPTITEQVFINASGIAAYNTGATDLDHAPPMFGISGTQVLGSTADGLHFSGSAASGSEVTALSIINFPDNGIYISNGANNIILRRNYIGVTGADIPAGNEGYGVYAFQTGGHQIGRRYDGNFFTSLGNVIANNGDDGVLLFQSDNNRLYGNRIGLSPDMTENHGNGGFGISIFDGDGNSIGGHDDDESGGNQIAGNSDGGVQIIGDGNGVYGNDLADNFAASGLSSPGDGIAIIGTTNTIGAAVMGRNAIRDHDGAGIVLGFDGGSAANLNVVQHNLLGRSGELFPSNRDGNGIGILVANGSTNVILNNTVVNSDGRGIDVNGDSNSLAGNLVGVTGSIGGGLTTEGNGSTGIRVDGNGNTIGNVVDNPNIVGDNTDGIVALGDNNLIRHNLVGVGEDDKDLGNRTHGIKITGANPVVEVNRVGNSALDGVQLNLATGNFAGSCRINSNFIGILPSGRAMGNGADGISVNGSSSGCDIGFNRIAFNGGDGINTDATALGIAWYQNLMHDNSQLGIDINNNGGTANDANDDDEGPQRQINYPAIISTTFNTSVSPPELTVQYFVDADEGNVSYPLYVDFYWTDRDEPMQGRYFLGTDFDYDTASETVTHTMTLPVDTPGGFVAATTLDGDERNTSELSDPVMFGTPDVIHIDGFGF